MKKLSLLLLGIIIIGCSGNHTDIAGEELADPVQEKQKEVIEIHDRVMAEMPELSKMSKQLLKEGENRKDSLNLYSHSLNVDLAKSRMMEWMREYKDPVGLNKPMEEKISYLESEKQKILEIEKFTEDVLEKGSKLLNKPESN